ncbi:hypothetical protein R8Z50_21815 [Longispora sp. K20-0274]|uniref:hypothetical protein n=1 Tax=Longispora sp. K20-0274 TaxID=3088255 RepID=UPI00399A5BD4
MRQGDLLTIPLSDTDVVVAQVLRSRSGVLLIAVFDGTFPAHAEISFVGRNLDLIRLIAQTMDARIGTGNWVVIDNVPVSGEVPIPIYKVQAGPGSSWYIQDIDGNILREARPAEIEVLRIPKSFSPVAVEKAIRAANGIEAWQERFDDMKPGWIRAAVELIGSS